MEFNRYEAKMRARASMRGAKPHVMLVALVFLLLTTGVDQLVSFILNNSQLVSALLDRLTAKAEYFDLTDGVSLRPLGGQT